MISIIHKYCQQLHPDCDVVVDSYNYFESNYIKINYQYKEPPTQADQEEENKELFLNLEIWIRNSHMVSKTNFFNWCGDKLNNNELNELIDTYDEIFQPNEEINV